MRMVASAKLHHTQGMTEAFLRYKDELEKTLFALSGISPSKGRAIQDENTMTHKPNGLPLEGEMSTGQKGSILLIPVSSNSGLCGAFNSNIAKSTMQRMQELEAQGETVHLLPIGKKIAHELKKANKDFNEDFVSLLEIIEKSNTFTDVSALVRLACELHQKKEIDNVEFLYHHFKSMGSQIITIDSLQLTADSSMRQEDQQGESQLSTFNFQLSTFLTEPSSQELLTSLFPRLLNAQVYGILLDSLTSEHAARMLAMQTADDNANDLLKELTLLYNKTRQQSITNELIDIMSGQIGKQ